MKQLRLVALVVAVVMCLVAFAGCASQSELDAVKAELETTKTSLKEAQDKIYAYENPEPYTSASDEVNTFPSQEVSGTELVALVNKYQGTYSIATTNPDGTPCLVHTIFGMKEYNGKYYLLFALKEKSQTRLNILSKKVGMCSFAENVYNADGSNNNTNGKKYACTGARIYFKLLEDETVKAELSKGYTYEIQIMEVTSTRPLG